MAVVEAILAYIMRRSAAAFRFFQRVGKCSRFELVQLVALLFAVPFFHVSNLAFQVLYTLRQRKLIRLSVERARLRGDDKVIQFNDLSLKHGSIAETYGRLRYIASRFDAANCALNREKIDHLSALSVLRANGGQTR